MTWVTMRERDNSNDNEWGSDGMDDDKPLDDGIVLTEWFMRPVRVSNLKCTSKKIASLREIGGESTKC